MQDYKKFYRIDKGSDGFYLKLQVKLTKFIHLI